MSLKVLVIPEDPTNNGYILRPLIGAILANAGKSKAKVHVLGSPKMEGYAQARDAVEHQLPDIYSDRKLWIFMPDSDLASPAAMQDLEKRLESKGIRLFCCRATPELEIYPCLAFKSDMGMSWDDARRHTKFKEEVFEPLRKKHGNHKAPGQGREEMTNESLKKMDTLFQFCPELKELRDRIAALSGE